MKNKYSFSLLEEKVIYSGLNKNELFFSMLNLTKRGNFIYSIDTFDELRKKLSGENFYIAHNLTAQKGKQLYFKGEIVVTPRQCLVAFLKKVIEIDDLRDFLISPVFDGSPSYVVSISDDSFYLCM